MIDSNYFNFTSLFHSIGKSKFCNHIGWSGLNVAKFLLKKNEIIDQQMIDKKFIDLKNKEKIFFTTMGEIKFVSSEKNVDLKKFDAINLLNIKNYSFTSLKETCFFMISSSNSKMVQNNFCSFFNFKKDLDAKNLWGGQIISTPYEGEELTLVLFELKAGFKFEDKGHSNEQITWLTDGEMDFYSNNIKKKLKTDMGISIGPNHIHGGLSNGAIGFDAFYPKRTEKLYKR